MTYLARNTVKRVGSMIARGGVGLAMWTVQLQRGQSSYSPQLEWKGVCTHASNAATSSKSFILNRVINLHKLLHQALCITLCIFLLCRLKIIHMKEL
jgi:hypothetical protein